MTTRTILLDSELDALRAVGDPDLTFRSAALAATLVGVRDRGLVSFAADGSWRKVVTKGVPVESPVALDDEMLRVAQRLFARFGTEIAGALLLAALPQSYATAFGAGVLGANERLESDLVRRIRGSAQFLVHAMQAPPDGDQRSLWDPSYETSRFQEGPPPWQLCIALRVYHQAIRAHLEDLRRQGNEQVIELLGCHNPTPLNQEDLLGMLLSFSVTVFEVLERYGITWTVDEQEAYLHAWDVIGGWLGIGSRTVVSACPSITADWYGLRPPSVDATRALLDRIRARQWIDPAPTDPFEVATWSSLRAGRILTKALLDELAAAMPPSLALAPIAVMRVLAPELVRRRLSLGSNGLALRALGHPVRRRRPIGRFTAAEVRRPIGARVLRVLANEVTSRAALRFMGDGDMSIPGLETRP